MLANVSNLQSCVIRDFVLNREVVLLHDRRLHCWVPSVDGGASVRVTGNWRRTGGRTCCRGERRGACVGCVRTFDLWLRERRILGEAQVRTSAFRIRRHGVTAANDCLVFELRRAPRETDTRLDVGPTVHGVVKAAAVAVLVRKFDVAGENVDIGLAIVFFNPGRPSFVTNAEIEREVAGDAEVVLKVTRAEPIALVPRAAGADALPDVAGKTESEVRARVARVLAGVKESAKFAGVAAVENVDAVAVGLEPDLEAVAAHDPAQVVSELDDGAAESFGNERAAQVGQRARTFVGNRAAAETDAEQARHAVRVRVCDSKRGAKLTDRRRKGGGAVGKRYAVQAAAEVVDERRSEGVNPVAF